jgi:hypothetical protein
MLLQGGLFTRDWLAEGVLEAPEWVDEPGKVLSEQLAALVRATAGRSNPNEAETERDLIYPVLELLGWRHLSVQQNMSAKGRSDVPDALLFLDGESADAAARREPSARFELGACLVEAKRWGAPLDRAGDRQQLQAPSTQLMHYLRRADDVTGGKLRWGILTNGRIWRLYWQGALSIAEDFLEIDLAKATGVEPPDLLDASGPGPEHVLRLFVLLFGRAAFIRSEAGTTLHQRALLAGRQWEARVAADLSDVVFDRVFPALVRALPLADPARPTEVDAAYLESVRTGALILLYRLLFVLYAEDRNLLPDEHGPYKAYALTALRHEIAEKRAGNVAFSDRMALIWPRICGIFTAIAHGDDSLGIPLYNGGLFAEDAAPILARVRLPDSIMADILFRLSHAPGTPRPHYINYRDLSVQQLGSIYESILEYGVEQGEDGSIGPVSNVTARHRSGSFYTPEELVGLIIDKAVGSLVLECCSAFEAKLEQKAKLPALHAADPAVAITNLRIVDPAMGSGHFLVSLVDWLADRVLTAMADASAQAASAGITDYISPLAERIAAIRTSILTQARAKNWPIVEDQLDDRHIVRRIVLKRCVYGVDLNPMAVELAKVALWLHSFTVGAPLSFLDHHLRCGNSLLGAWVRPASLTLSNRGSLFISGRIAQLDGIAKAMERIEAITDSDVAEVEESKSQFSVVEEATRPLGAMFDLVTAETNLGIFSAVPSDARKAVDRAGLSGSESDSLTAERTKVADALYAKQEQLGMLGIPDRSPVIVRAPKRSAAEIEAANGTAAQVARAREAELAFLRAQALQHVLEATYGDPFELALGSHVPESATAKAVLGELRAFAADHRLFHWEIAFPGVWQSLTSEGRTGGFDAVIGNPPYVRQELLGAIKPALKQAYATFDGMADLYVYFYEQGLKLLRPGGRMSYVVTNKWLKAGYAEKLRAMFAEQAWVEFVADFGHAKHLFADADVFPCVIGVRKPDGGPAPDSFDLAVIARDDVPREGLAAAVADAKALALLTTLRRDGWSLEPPGEAALLEKIRRNGVPLVEAAGCKPYRGVLTGFNEAFLIDTATRDRLVAADPASAAIIKPYLRGQDIDRWQPDWAGLWMIFTRRGIDIERYPAVLAHLQHHRCALEPRPANWAPTNDKPTWPGRKDGSYKWYEIQDSVDYWPRFANPKIYYQEIQFHARYAFDAEGRFGNNKTFFVETDDLTILAVLNSPLMWWHNWRHLPHMKDEALTPMGFKMEQVPIARFGQQQSDALLPTVNLALQRTADVRSADRAILDWLRTEFGLEKIPRALGEPSRLDADGFAAAVRAALPRRRALSAADIARLRTEHAATIAPAREQRLQLAGTERRISDLVNTAYGLTPEDVALMWKTAPPRMPIAAPDR